MKKILLVFLLVSRFAFSQSISLSNTGSLNFARVSHKSQLLSNGKVLAFGGDNGYLINNVVYSSSELYDPILKTWTMSGNMKKPRVWFSSVLLNNGNIMAIGGAGVAENSCEIYDVKEGSWSFADSLNIPRYGHDAIRLNNGDILVAGGSTKKCEIYDQSTGKWTLTGDLNSNRGDGVSMVLMEDGRVFLSGGNSFDAAYSSEIYNPLNGQWSLVPGRMYGGRYYHNSIKLNNGKILMAGTGYAQSSGQNNVDIYDPVTNKYSSNTLSIGIGSSPMVLLENGNVMLYGIGDVFNPTNTKCIQIFNTTNNQ